MRHSDAAQRAASRSSPRAPRTVRSRRRCSTLASQRRVGPDACRIATGCAIADGRAMRVTFALLVALIIAAAAQPAYATSLQWSAPLAFDTAPPHPDVPLAA